MPSFTDIRFDLIKSLPEKVKPYALLARLDRPVGVWLLLLPCLFAFLMAGPFTYTFSPLNAVALLSILILGSFFMRAAGCVINDIWDRKIDAQVERTALRPLASGALSLKQALIFLGILLGLSCALLLQLHPLSIWIGIGAIIPIALYPLMKRITYWPQAFLGLTFNLGVLITWAHIEGTLSISAYILYAGTLFWTLAYDTIYAHQDIEDDQKIGVKSTALRFRTYSKYWVYSFYATFFLCLVAAGYFADANWLYYIALLPAIAKMLHLMRNWALDNQHAALEGFKANITLGFWLLPAFFLA